MKKEDFHTILLHICEMFIPLGIALICFGFSNLQTSEFFRLQGIHSLYDNTWILGWDIIRTGILITLLGFLGVVVWLFREKREKILMFLGVSYTILGLFLMVYIETYLILILGIASVVGGILMPILREVVKCKNKS